MWLADLHPLVQAAMCACRADLACRVQVALSPLLPRPQWLTARLAAWASPQVIRSPAALGM